MNYSIIIPTKNIPDLLKRCIESIPQREDLEVLVIDDCSTEECITKTIDFISTRKDIRLFINQESHGAGYCRNVGLEEAKGRWLLFADSDDFYTDNINEILNKYKADDLTDIVYMNAQKYFPEGGVAQLNVSRYINNYKRGKIYSEKVLRYGIWSPWTRMVKRKLVIDNNLKFDEIPTGNDMYFCLNCSYYAKSMAAEEIVCYNYYMPPQGSITQSYYQSRDNAINKIDLKIKVIELHRKTGYIFRPSFYYDLFKLNHVNNKGEYRRAYLKYLKTKKINLFTDALNLLLERCGKLIGVL